MANAHLFLFIRLKKKIKSIDLKSLKIFEFMEIRNVKMAELCGTVEHARGLENVG